MSEQQLIRGTVILTASVFISKILGLIYVFPFTAIVGTKGMALYTYGYLPYTIMLSLSTLGVPLAVSKFVSKYNALGDYRTGQRLLKSGIVVMLITGIIAFLALFSLAEPIANQVVDPTDLKGNSYEDVIFAVRMVSVALLIVPVMAIIRGYFQGHQSMGPTAVSQVIEQIVRIVFILLFAFLILNVWNGELGTAVGIATFGAFVGALGGLAVLLIYWKKRGPSLKKQIDESTVEQKLPLRSMYKELLTYAIPLSIVGLAIPLYQLVDMVTFNQAMQALGYDMNVVETYYGAFSQTTHKLIQIPVALGTAMSLTIIPTVTNAFINEEHDRLQRTITQTYQIILFLTVPAAIGLTVLAEPVYGALFGLADLAEGAEVLRSYAWIAVAFAIFAVTAAILQGINRQKWAVIALLAGLAFKILSNTLLISWFEVHGAILATGIGYIIAIAINIWAIKKYANYDYTFVFKRFLLVCLFTGMMAIVVGFLQYGLMQLLPINTRMDALIILAVTVLSGIVVYLNLGIRSGLAGQILGERFKFLNK
ncbi:oligosaccharide flippase family protein [Salipaludibacillus agaradhaerens]|uniref:Oligosaccharide flippase family protein n=1 Tax=Salipaludibacillus agaradhaerens TaxID=76935 RepID=A0A9Q4AZS6_SALAG|nr:oligosaccharide flippase family protein [Salipaludibacillus agaradhaerens]MCR6095456.1 oligosaccharide flippase family protein [Salipaludibacillus agaradhaerens]MCR6114984.1 oligosaccharide flippase family protein [Salipaludibacillus agaradhaerens]